MSELDVAGIKARLAAATPGPWRAMRDGNQYIKTNYLPTAQVVGASRVEGLVRPWNPHAYLGHGFRPSEFETCRFLDADADFIAAARTDVELLITALEASQAECERVKAYLEDVAGELGAELMRGAGGFHGTAVRMLSNRLTDKDTTITRLRELLGEALEGWQALSGADEGRIAAIREESKR